MRARTRANSQLVLLAVEPTGVGPYVEAVQELIEQVVAEPAPVVASPAPAFPAPPLRVVR